MCAHVENAPLQTHLAHPLSLLPTQVTQRESIQAIQEWTKAAIITKGAYYPPGRNAPPGERKLFLFIEAESQAAVKAARKELKRIVQEASMAAAPDDSSTNRYAKYTV